jgi:hypothetical protein
MARPSYLQDTREGGGPTPCVPQVYAPALTKLMDRVQETARSIA